MSDHTDADRFYKEASDYFYALASGRNLGIALGRWSHPRFGEMRVIAVYGWLGQLYATLVCCATEAALANEQARLWWYFADQTEPFEFKHVESRRPMSQTTVRGMEALESTVEGNLIWLKDLTVEEVVADQMERNVAPVAKADEARDDVRVALAEDLPKGDEEEP